MERKEKLVKLYSYCEENGYLDMSDDKQSIKAKVYATDLKLKYKKIEVLFSEAKDAYEEYEKERIEREERAKLAKEKAEKRAEEEKKKAKARANVAGTELFCVTDEKEAVHVYRRDDGSLYYITEEYGRFNMNAVKGLGKKSGTKINKSISFNIKSGGYLTYTYHEPKFIYTGASSGGISMGGVHKSGGYATQKIIKNGTGSIIFTYGETQMEVKEIAVSDAMHLKFKRDKNYNELFHSRSSSIGDEECYAKYPSYALCYDYAGEKYANALLYANAGSSLGGDKIASLSKAIDEGRISYQECQGILDFVFAMMNAHYPPQDDELYAKAEELSKENDLTKLKESIDIYNLISDYKDSAELVKNVQKKHDDIIQAEKERKIIAKEKRQKKNKRNLIVSLLLLLVFAFVGCFVKFYHIPNQKYNEAKSLLDSGSYTEAIIAFEKLDGFKDSLQCVEEAKVKYAEQEYNTAMQYYESFDYRNAIKHFSRAGDYNDSRDKFREILKEIAVKETISATYINTVAVKTNGQVISTEYKGNNFFYKGQDNVDDWRDIVAVSASEGHTVGLKTDGTVVAVGDNKYGQCEVSSWRDIVSIYATSYMTVGLTSNGIVLTTKSLTDELTDVIAIGGMYDSVIALKADGTVVSTDVDYNTSGWSDIVEISTSDGCVAGLKSDGTVVVIASSSYSSKLYEASNWNDIVSVSANETHIVGLKSDGSVVSTAFDYDRYKYYNGECEVGSWSDIVSISACGTHTIGLKSNGRIISTEYIGNELEEYSGQCEVSGWNNIKLPENK